MAKDEPNEKSVLVQLRRELNLSQKALAEALEVSEQTIRNWEHGRTIPQLTIPQMKALCEMLKRDIREIPDWLGPIDQQPGGNN